MRRNRRTMRYRQQQRLHLRLMLQTGRPMRKLQQQPYLMNIVFKANINNFHLAFKTMVMPTSHQPPCSST
ncbi:hypothetical protein A2U01_0067449 [Trifolium medium]|uniref:Uncharacterized protein n=1 Tax=Trifolium medium TaxID=97028 RepID=A0A392SC21_9FABA|nr:hypothetical protein [Trifolium medium]